MAKRVAQVLTIQVPAGEANPAAVGKDVGPLGINIMEFCRQFNAATGQQRGLVVPARITVHEDRTFLLDVRTPTTASLLRQAAGVPRGSATPNREPAGSLTRAALREVASRKLADLNTTDLAAAEKIVAGTARSMGLTITD